MNLTTISVSTPRPGIALATLNRVQQLNAIDRSMFRDLRTLCETMEQQSAVRVLVLTGAGRGFCSGLDLTTARELADLSTQEFWVLQEQWSAAIAGFRSLSKPVIAAVNGPAAGAGFALALAADVRLAAPTARFNAAFVRIGLSGGDVGTSWLLPRIVGLGHAYEILLTGRFVDADEAFRVGLVNGVVPADDLLDAAFDLGEEIAANSPFGVALTKRVVQTNVDAPSLEAAIQLENRNQVLTSRTDDMREALAAFLAKRSPNYSNT